METQEQAKYNQRFSKNNIHEELKTKREKFNFEQRKKEESKKSIEELINETQQAATNISKNSQEYNIRVKANIYEIANKVGINLYNFEIKKLINKNQKILNQLNEDKKNFEDKLYGNDDIQGLIQEKKSISEDITELNNLINISYLAKEEFEKGKDEIQDKIEIAKEKNDFDSIKVFRNQQDKLISETEELTDTLENYEDDYFYKITIFQDLEKEIDEKKFTIRHLKNNIQNYKKEISAYQKFLGDRNELISYLNTNKLLEKSNSEIKKLVSRNKIIEEKSYFTKDRILKETKSISREEGNLVQDEQRIAILKDMQERKDNLTKVNELYAQIMKR